MLTTRFSISSGARSAGPERMMPAPPPVHRGGEPVESRNILGVLGTIDSPCQPARMICSARAIDAPRQPLPMTHCGVVADALGRPLGWVNAVSMADPLWRPRQRMRPGGALRPVGSICSVCSVAALRLSLRLAAGDPRNDIAGETAGGIR